ncbi:aspartyl protease family protein [Candidatus Phyllobacterium onerii]|uniref:aspartyl protease family protein n=1 Tax=Candidatus Phyllobacterium onerii TaxID=3020828 RepID=UPI00232E19CF|nr:aspartyl protease family protein [Phyllobacterium sp. IY22]
MLKADWEDRNGGMVPPSVWKEYIIIGLILCIVLGGGVSAYVGLDMVSDKFRQIMGINPAAVPKDFYSRLEFEPLPGAVVNRNPMAGHIAALLREPCDWNSSYAFAGDLQQAGYPREAAKVFLAFSAKCRASDVALYSAADILYGLSDLPAALAVSEDLLAMSPDLPQSYYLRGRILHDAKRYKEAINAYDSVLGLTEDLALLNNEVFRRMSLTYVALADYCEAMTPIQTWVSIDPSKNDTPAAQAMIKDYSTRGKCEGSYATGKDRFPTQGKDVITAKVSINGVSGIFVVDTGASFVSLTRRFAERAKVPLSGDLSVRMQSANGISLAQRSSAKQIRIGRVEAKDVAAIVLADSDKPLGDGIDGLLGRSFLSRFDVSFGARDWRIESK